MWDIRGHSPPDATSAEQALEAFYSAPELERLDALIDQFNVFEALGIARRKLSHSRFLAFLLDPRQSHRLGDSFLRLFLDYILSQAESKHVKVPEIDIAALSLDRVAARCEFDNIDVLLEDPVNRIAVLVENKIDTGEHSDQLSRYLSITEQRLPTWRIIPVYLTPHCESPSHLSYVPIGYNAVCDLVGCLCSDYKDRMHPDVFTIASHYVQLLRKHIVSDSEIAILCKQIYRKHRRALDVLFEHRPHQWDSLEELVETHPDLVLVRSTPTRVSFLHRSLDILSLKQGSVAGWKGFRVMFEFLIDKNLGAASLELVVEKENSPVRQRLIDIAVKHGSPFNLRMKEWPSLYQRTFVRPSDKTGLSPEDLVEHITQQWEEFHEHDMPTLVDAITSGLNSGPVSTSPAQLDPDVLLAVQEWLHGLQRGKPGSAD